MATTLLGRTTAGTTADFTAVNNPAAWKFVAVASGTLATVNIQKKVANASMTSIQLAVYDDTAGGTRPGALLAQGSTSTGVTGTGVITVSGLSVAITNGVTYWLAWRPIGSRMDFQGTSAGAYVENVGAGAFADPWTVSGNSSGTIDAILWGEDAGGGGGSTQQTLTLLGVGS